MSEVNFASCPWVECFRFLSTSASKAKVPVCPCFLRIQGQSLFPRASMSKAWSRYRKPSRERIHLQSLTVQSVYGWGASVSRAHPCPKPNFASRPWLECFRFPSTSMSKAKLLVRPCFWCIRFPRASVSKA